MGLDCTHGAFSGAYSAFNRLRQEVCRAMGGSFPPHEDASRDFALWYWGPGYSEETHPGLYEFLFHSDCDGEIAPQECQLVADDLEALLPRISEDDGGGHIRRGGGYRAVAMTFVNGCRVAAMNDEPLLFR